MTLVWRRALTYAPPLFLGLCAAAISPGMRTGAIGYEFYQDVRAYFLGAAFAWFFSALLVRGYARLFEKLQPLKREFDSGMFSKHGTNSS